jgi:hypothetical protein
MKHFFASNLDRNGRFVRGTVAGILMVGALVCFFFLPPLGLILLILGLFVLFEAVRGWCVLRACGIKTKI